MMTIKEMPPEAYPESMTANIEFNNIVYTSPYNGEEQTEARAGEKWVLTFSYSELEEQEARVLHAFLLSLEGVVGRFRAIDFASATLMGSMTGLPKVQGNLNTGSTCLMRDAPRNRDVLKIGDYVQISGRLHMLTETVRTDSSGNGTLKFIPPMRIVPSDGALIEYKDLSVTCRLIDNKQGKRSSKDMLSSFSFNAIEAY